MKEFNFKKKYGQNFLIDNNILNKIIKELNITSEDLIIEIGVGSGILTKELIKFNSQIIGYEIDLETKKYLDNLNSSNLKIIYDNVLNRKLKDDIKNIKYKNLYIIGNLPYYITTPIIEKITQEKLNPKEMFFMVQKEVAERLSSFPRSKEYGYITVYLNYFYKIYKLFDVSRKSFFPSPNVESSVIKFVSHNNYKCNNEKIFIDLISKAFKHKRKTLLNNLKMYDQQIIKNILQTNNFSHLVRAEELPIEFFLEITNAL